MLIALYSTYYNYATCRDNMRALLAIAVIACYFAVVSSQSCSERLTQLSTCITKLGTTTPTNPGTFCNDCGDSLIAYYQACTNGVGVDAVKLSEFITAEICQHLQKSII